MASEHITAQGGGEVPENEHSDATQPRPEAASPGTKHHCPDTSSNKTNTSETDKHWLEYATAVFALVAALGSISAAVIGYWQWQAIRESFTATQRAFVIVTGVEVHTTPRKGDGMFAFAPVIKNSGTTPTSTLEYGSSVGQSGAQPTLWLKETYPGVEIPYVPSDPEFFYNMMLIARNIDPKFAPHDFPRHDVVGPQQSISVDAPSIYLSESNIRCFSEMGLNSIISGVIHYHDVFPGSPAHTTKFCFVIYPGQDSLGTFQPRYSHCSHWNCVDAECNEDADSYDKQVHAAFTKAGKQFPQDFRAGLGLIFDPAAVKASGSPWPAVCGAAPKDWPKGPLSGPWGH